MKILKIVWFFHNVEYSQWILMGYVRWQRTFGRKMWLHIKSISFCTYRWRELVLSSYSWLSEHSVTHSTAISRVLYRYRTWASAAWGRRLTYLRLSKLCARFYFVPRRELSVNIIQTNRYIIFRELINFDCKNHTKYSIKTSRGKMQKFFKWQGVVLILTTGLWKVKRVKTFLCLKAMHQIFNGSAEVTTSISLCNQACYILET